MTIQIALLRAVNVGGRTKLPMADLRKVFAGLGYEDARTVLQTGNVVFSAAHGGQALEAELEKAVAAELGLKTDILLRSAAEWDGIVAANPFPDEAESDPSHLVVMPLKGTAPKSAVAELNAAIQGREIVKADGAQLYITYPDGIGRSKLTIGLIEKKIGCRGTGRNWNTILKIAEAARAAS
ncbi:MULTISPECIES: DUF1697 domain-containing protein [Rhodomicrobium]|uniref:DUF1697 domain-containing protein n=1 Tax=Rhodomicrobium TaxID=1068 RepID=UPI000B4A681D|nr:MULTISPECIES: DUF1697 domain-containing protein [Rhodomicrobium]